MPVYASAGVLNVANLERETPLIVAARLGYADVVQHLVRCPGIDILRPNYRGVSAVIVATRERHRAVVRVLVEAGANVTSEVASLLLSDIGSSHGFVSVSGANGGASLASSEASSKDSIGSSQRSHISGHSGHSGYSQQSRQSKQSKHSQHSQHSRHSRTSSETRTVTSSELNAASSGVSMVKCYACEKVSSADYVAHSAAPFYMHRLVCATCSGHYQELRGMVKERLDYVSDVVFIFDASKRVVDKITLTLKPSKGEFVYIYMQMCILLSYQKTRFSSQRFDVHLGLYRMDASTVTFTPCGDMGG
jgi:Ankyrin repeats (3 copies)